MEEGNIFNTTRLEPLLGEGGNNNQDNAHEPSQDYSSVLSSLPSEQLFDAAQDNPLFSDEWSFSRPTAETPGTLGPGSGRDVEGNMSDGQVSPKTLDKEIYQAATYLPTEESEEGLQPATLSHPGSFEVPAEDPMSDEESDEDKENITWMQQPSSTASNAFERIAAHQPQSEPNRPDTPEADIRGTSPPPSPGSHQPDPDSSPSMSPSVQTTPVFITMGADSARFAPFMEEGPTDPNESIADIMIRDQIRRSAAVLGRPLTSTEEEIIRCYYQDVGQGRGPSEADEPTAVHSPTFLDGFDDEESVNIPVDHGANAFPNREHPLPPLPGMSASQTPDTFVSMHSRKENDTQDATSERPQPIFDSMSEHIAHLEAELKEAEERRNAYQKERDAARGNLTCLQLERECYERRFAKLEEELGAAKTKLVELTARVDRAEASKAEKTACKCAEPACRPARQFGPVRMVVVLFAVAVLVWVVTEAVVHSNRLLGGYGGVVNGGFNGLGSVLIFGTWTRVLAFVLTIMFLSFCMFWGR